LVDAPAASLEAPVSAATSSPSAGAAFSASCALGADSASSDASGIGASNRRSNGASASLAGAANGAAPSLAAAADCATAAAAPAAPSAYTSQSGCGIVSSNVSPLPYARSTYVSSRVGATNAPTDACHSADPAGFSATTASGDPSRDSAASKILTSARSM
jgi:hypothetical protein